jgi:transposase
MGKLTRIGIDTSKSVFQLHGVDDDEQPTLKRKLRRQDLHKFFGDLPFFGSGWKPADRPIIGRASFKRWAMK